MLTKQKTDIVIFKDKAITTIPSCKNWSQKYHQDIQRDTQHRTSLTEDGSKRVQRLAKEN